MRNGGKRSAPPWVIEALGSRLEDLEFGVWERGLGTDQDVKAVRVWECITGVCLHVRGACSQPRPLGFEEIKSFLIYSISGPNLGYSIAYLCT